MFEEGNSQGPIIYGTSSEERIGLARSRWGVYPFSVIHALSPKTAGLNESKEKPPVETSWEKAIALLHFLDVINEIPNDLNVDLTDNFKSNSKIKNPFWLFTSDVEAVAARSELGLETAETMHKLERDLRGLTPKQQKKAISDDKTKVSEIYTNPDGTWLQWNIGSTLLHVLANSHLKGVDVKSVADLEIKTHMPMVSQREIDLAYTNPDVTRINPRVDMARRLPQANSIQIKDKDANEKSWITIPAEVASLLIIGGIPPQPLMRRMMDNRQPVSKDVHSYKKMSLQESLSDVS